MNRIWICGLFGKPEGVIPEACSPRHQHGDWTCGWAYEGSRDYVDTLEKYGHSIIKPKVHHTPDKGAT